MRNLLGFALVALLAVPAFAITGDTNNNGVIDQGNSGEKGKISEGIKCASGLTAWSFTTKAWSGLGAGQNYAGDGSLYMCWSSSCVPKDPNAAALNAWVAKPTSTIPRPTIVNNINSTIQRPCCPGSTLKSIDVLTASVPYCG